MILFLFHTLGGFLHRPTNTTLVT